MLLKLTGGKIGGFTIYCHFNIFTFSQNDVEMCFILILSSPRPFAKLMLAK